MILLDVDVVVFDSRINNSNIDGIDNRKDVIVKLFFKLLLSEIFFNQFLIDNWIILVAQLNIYAKIVPTY